MSQSRTTAVTGINVIGKLTEDQLNSVKSGGSAVSGVKTKEQRERNILLNELLKKEADRFKVHQALVREWSKNHKRFATEVNLIINATNELHSQVVSKLNELPLSKDSQVKYSLDVDRFLYDGIDIIEDKMYAVEQNEVNISREEMIKYREDRDRKHEAKLAEEEENELSRLKAAIDSLAADVEKQRQEENANIIKKEAEDKQRKEDTLNILIQDNTMALNINNINPNLISLPPSVGVLLKKRNMLYSKIAKTKSGDIVIVCIEPIKESKNIIVSTRGSRTICNIASGSFCKYIRAKYDINDTDEYLFNIKVVEYANDVKIKICSII